MKIHPSHCFPLLPDDELQYLAQDIKKNGLFKPIIVDDEGQLVDGRNRLLACEIAGVEPRFEKMPAGWDARDYMLSVNLIRKSISKSQKAMWLAMAVEMYPDADIAIPEAGAFRERFKQACGLPPTTLYPSGRDGQTRSTGPCGAMVAGLPASHRRPDLRVTSLRRPTDARADCAVGGGCAHRKCANVDIAVGRPQRATGHSLSADSDILAEPDRWLCEDGGLGDSFEKAFNRGVAGSSRDGRRDGFHCV
jgi:hypothetical protein